MNATPSFAGFGLPLPPEDLLRREGCSDRVIQHCREVARRALLIADRLAVRSDRNLVYVGAMLHDLGRCRSQGIDHVSTGATVARRLGLDDRVVRIIRTHIGAGLPPDEATALGLPPDDYLPRSVEEKIVAHADNLTRGTVPVGFDVAIRRLEDRLGPSSPPVARIRRLRTEILSWATSDEDDPEGL